MAYFDNLIYTLERWGVADVLLPFLLIFAVVFAILEMTHIFGPNKKNINSIVSLVMGLAVIFPHVTGSYPPNRDVVEIINRALPGVSLLLIAIVSLLVVMGLLTGGRFRLKSGNPWAGFFTLVMLIAVIGIFMDAARLWDTPRWLWFIRDPGLQSAVVIIAFFWFIIGFITKGAPGRGDQGTGGGGNRLGKVLTSLSQMNDEPPDDDNNNN